MVLLQFLADAAFAFLEVRVVDIPRLSWSGLEVTLENFADVLTARGFWDATRTTVLYAVGCTVGSIATGLLVALALRRPFRGRGAVRAVLLVPYVLPVVAAATIWEIRLASRRARAWSTIIHSFPRAAFPPLTRRSRP